MEKNKTSENLGQKMRYDYLVKIKMVGDSNAGKSSIVMRFYILIKIMIDDC
jgi:GTPase SAR1 family protein